jgi:hypothetical protein
MPACVVPAAHSAHSGLAQRSCVSDRRAGTSAPGTMPVSTVTVHMAVMTAAVTSILQMGTHHTTITGRGIAVAGRAWATSAHHQACSPVTTAPWCSRMEAAQPCFRGLLPARIASALLVGELIAQPTPTTRLHSKCRAWSARNALVWLPAKASLSALPRTDQTPCMPVWLHLQAIAGTGA